MRWVQRFNHFGKAFSQLKEACDLEEKRPLTKLEEQGLIQAFEFTHELAWNTLRDFLTSRGVRELYGSRDVTREAFRAGLIENGEAWMDMIKSRNLTVHTYNEKVAAQVAQAITDVYVREFDALLKKLEPLKSKDEGE
ncbi:MAG: nucleotidyltransferase substrate binding protein [Anaerolineae bacterium]